MKMYFDKLKLVLRFSVLLTYVHSWKTCDETFCKRVRQSPEGYSRYSLDLTNFNISEQSVEGILTTESPLNNLRMTILAFTSEVFQVIIFKTPPGATRNNLIKITEPSKTFPLKVLERNSEKIIFENQNTKAIIYGKPFKIEFYSSDELVSVINHRDRLVYETEDSNTAIALDVTFVEAQRAYGIPLHADQLPLQNTGPGRLDPYRLYNVHNANYKIKSTEALHGSVPVLYGHGTKRSSGVFWYNAAQTWVDITTAPNYVDAFFMSESPIDNGLLSLYVLTGPTLAKATQQYTSITQKSMVPQYFALGYHQSRCSYTTQDEVLNVVEQFDKSNLPLDVVWLDVDYTDNRKFFTWDSKRFPAPLELQSQLAATNRKLMALIGPNIKAEKGYFVHDEAIEKGYYVQNPGGTSYLGLSPSELSGYLDFANLDVLNYYASLFAMDSFNGENIFVWNDMNEPVVLENLEHENTLAGDLLHKGFIHRELHNGYGTFQSGATFLGLVSREHFLRPFSVARSHYAVTQAYAAVWTGDNYASWEHLEISFPMCLAEALAGISFCGANVGGFNGIPSDELYQRWYQAAAWLPLYRGHSAKDVPRREPYLYSEGIQARVRTALNQRYSHIPVWYTSFWEHANTGAPVICPITYYYPTEDDALSIDNELLLGPNILVAPVLKPGVFITSVYLPGGESELWYNIDDNYKVFPGTGYVLLYVDLDSVPVFYRGGSVIARKDKPRQSTGASNADPYTLYVCLDSNNQANGTLYVDDYKSFNYIIKSEYLYLGFSFIGNTFSSYKIHPDADYNGAAGIGQIVILHPPQNLTSAKFIGKDISSNDVNNMEIAYNEDKSILTISKMLLNLQNPFEIKLYTLNL